MVAEAHEIAQTMPWVSRTTSAVGVDIGQAQDPTALCAIEGVFWRIHQRWAADHRWPNPNISLSEKRIEQIRAAKPKDELRVRLLQRLPLGLSYIDQCVLLADVLARPALSAATVWLDATGVGKPISDLFKRAGVKHSPVWITGGKDEQPHGTGFSVPKIQLISRLQAALHSGELKIAKALPEAVAFTRELQEFRVSWTEMGNMRFGARQGAHDDLVLAAALAVYGVTRNETRSSSVVPLAIYGKQTMRF